MPEMIVLPSNDNPIAPCGQQKIQFHNHIIRIYFLEVFLVSAVNSYPSETDLKIQDEVAYF